ncbi:MAG: hypothetical protein KAY65_17370 [Planctomycetes bacterium]|nr:hypothetical protein [Planctomycetota bacterium]
MPEKVIHWCLKLPVAMSEALKSLGDRVDRPHHQAGVMLLFWIIALGGSLLWDWPFAAGMALLLVCLMVTLYVGGKLVVCQI